jgi:site-specific DNA-methyltransferase (adenine-specific)
MERLLCSCGWDVTPKFQGDTGFVFHVFGGHQVTVSCDRKIGPFDCCSVVQGDCLELMKQLPDGCVDAVISDITRHGESAGRERKAQDGCRDVLGAEAFGDCVPVSRQGNVSNGTSASLRSGSTRDSQGSAASRDCSQKQGAQGSGEWPLHSRHGEHALSEGHREAGMQPLQFDGEPTDSPRQRESHGQCEVEFGSAVLPLPYKPPQAGILAKAEIAIVSDPPYGVKLNTRTLSTQRGRHANKGFRGHDLVRDFAAVHGDDKPFNPDPFIRFNYVILWGANHYSHNLPASARWLIWDKRCGSPSDDNADCEIAWTNLRGQARVFSQYWRGWLREGEENLSISGPKLHPAQKPERLMRWCIEHVPENCIVLDPFAGSGTTLVAAKKLGRHFLGFEISPEYCQIARDRLARIDAQPSLFTQPPQQMTIEEGQ